MPSIIKLKEGEGIKVICRQSLWRKWWQIISVIVIFLAPFFFLYPLFQFGWPGIIGFGALILISLVWGLRIYVSYFFTFIAGTNWRVIDVCQKGFFFRQVSTASYNKVEQISYRKKGLADHLLGGGELIISLGGPKKIKYRLKDVRRVEKIIGILNEALEDYLDSHPNDSSEAEYLLNKLKNKLGREKFYALIED